MFSYDTYEAGRTYGISAYDVSGEICRKWRDLYGKSEKEDPDSAPLGIITLIQQEAMNQILIPRTLGNVQATQVFDIETLPAVGTTVYTEVSCLSKEFRKQRRWVQLAFRTRDAAGGLLFRSRNLIIVPS